MMDMNGVLSGSSRTVAIADEHGAVGKPVDGHAHGISRPRLEGYPAAGIGSDHEITSGEALLEKLRAGLAIEIRGSHNYILPPIVEALSKLPHLSSQIMFCTDDVQPDHLVAFGGIKDVLRRFIAAGMKPLDAIRFATFNAALHLGRRDLGAVCAGRIADIVILSDLEAITITDVFVSGRHAARNGSMLHPVTAPPVATPAGTVHIPPRSDEHFRLPVKSITNGRVLLTPIKRVLFSHWSMRDLEVRDGFAVLPPADAPNGDLNLLYVQHRHGRHEDPQQDALQEGLPRLNGSLRTT